MWKQSIEKSIIEYLDHPAPKNSQVLIDQINKVISEEVLRKLINQIPDVAVLTNEKLEKPDTRDLKPIKNLIKKEWL